MKIVTMIARYLLGLMFLVFGSNMFLQFIPMGPMPAGLAGQFYGRLVCRTLLLRGGRDHGRVGDSAFGEPVCGPGADAAGSGAVQYPALSSHDEPGRYWGGSVCNAALGACCLGAPDCV